MGKLLCAGFNEDGNDRNRRTFANKASGHYLEAVESSKQKAVGITKLRIGKDRARLTSYCGDHYYWVVTKTCVVRAISKEVLAKAGLISCLDYYNERHALKLC